MEPAERHLPPFLQAMLDPAFFAHQPKQVRLVQTHISYVVIAPPLVYKVKKPVRFRFLDFSSAELRKHFCHEEVRLNRRLAPHVYRRVVGIREYPGGYALCDVGDPTAFEFAVEMNFLPEDLRLDVRLARQQVGRAEIARIATVLAHFHRHAECSDEISAAARPEALESIWRDNFLEAFPFRGQTVSVHDDTAIQQFVAAFLEQRRAALEARLDAHRIRDGHGDLHADHIYLDGEVTIVDCIEFNERLRWCDVAADLAFLAMDLDFRDHPELARALVQEYVHRSSDFELRQLLPFYQCYRAYVRGKVESLKSAEPEVPEQDRSAARTIARRYFELAYRYTWAHTRALLVMAGLSGTGKSTIASLLHRRTGFAWYRSDVLRKQLAGLAPGDDASQLPHVYSPEFSQRTYRALFEAGRTSLEAGHGVILDATFLAKKYRDAARQLAAELDVPLLFVVCECAPEEVRARLAARQSARADVSDADWQVYLSQREHAEPLSEEETASLLRLDTTARDPLELATLVEDTLRQHVPSPGNWWGTVT